MIQRILTSSADGDDDDSLFNVAIATIFAREFLEAAIIIGNYRTVINKNEKWDDERKAAALKEVTRAAAFASFIAILVVIAVAVPLGILSKDLDDDVVKVVEGVSKVVATVCILQLSLKIPQWLGLYWKVSIVPCKNKDKKHSKEDLGNLTTREIRFNVAWNIWREVAECGVFLIPFFLGTGAEAIPISALVGIAIAAVLGFGIYIANHKMANKFWLAFFMSGLTLFLAVGLAVGGLHEFEEVWGMTKNVYTIENENMSHKKFPMVVFKVFGYSASRSVLQITTFWLTLALGLTLHYLKWTATKKAMANYVPEADEEPTTAKDVEGGDIDQTQDIAEKLSEEEVVSLSASA
jgi:high-affinity iron transporter